ncbi:MAG TPA: hypothetical protein VIF14_18510 [Alphaproteobacteria bacterium]
MSQIKADDPGRRQISDIELEQPPMRPITDRAEVAIDLPEKTYVSGFGHTGSFAAGAAVDGVQLKLVHAGLAKRSVDLHLHWYLFADILDEIAASLEGRAGLVDQARRDALADAVQRLAAALAAAPPPAESQANGAARHG